MNKIGENTGNRGKGRPAGSPNRISALLKDAILKAATNAGKGDMVAYLTQQARDNPGPFMALLGKVLPLQISGDADSPLSIVTRIELVAPRHEGMQ
ncbi:hypothetical protein QFZ34_003258 [Phyllobacterium ifriqiyense]|uniref:Uncharacterized protein n=1 Tax=Phyllobacterium ifriqiyense TaxID=314238 RepID=A0ABU0SC70_9HYPH|nr:hypothetical protein [Phyllobacterium ifriqiyense]MDQ0998076.1 hypothetical protein [Phyllobacterium ifriqiyense]